jgi:hypothetical protein
MRHFQLDGWGSLLTSELARHAIVANEPAPGSFDNVVDSVKKQSGMQRPAEALAIRAFRLQRALSEPDARIGGDQHEIIRTIAKCSQLCNEMLLTRSMAPSLRGDPRADT